MVLVVMSMFLNISLYGNAANQKKRRNTRQGFPNSPPPGPPKGQPLLGRQQALWRAKVLGWGQTTPPWSCPAWHVCV